jgi:dephospho-CoA kinase
MPYARNVLTIGITGGIASGKSTVAQLLAASGVHVVDADQLAHETYAPGAAGYDPVLAAFGPSVLAPDGAIDRRALGRIVFADPAQMARLTAIVWPLTRKRLEALIAAAGSEGEGVVAVEAVALREAGWAGLFNQVWLVRSPIDAVRARLTRRGLTEGEAEARIAAQPAAATDPAGADLVIDNDGSLDALKAKVDAALQAVLKRRR